MCSFSNDNLYWAPVPRIHLHNWFEWRRLNAQNDELVVTRQSVVAEQSFVEQIAGDAVFAGRIRFPCAAQVFAHLLAVDVDAMPNELLRPSKMRKEFRYPGNHWRTMGPCKAMSKLPCFIGDDIASAKTEDARRLIRHFAIVVEDAVPCVE